ncbi:hypothetical protein C9374_003143 [Naegleria lovaniensis]|uniref:AAA+ ATPase domain-containing protein n=1 Tax=Naegleria lovaniensis TaxID=51637 RepID=A0AA88GTS5_NAELO|nr:uncharacterized protein C9374_003143 [Naegleria lovaniensis]KAG2385994.1 hypothetical protein C9374_003143 [Naegleria lovaniensis]
MTAPTLEPTTGAEPTTATDHLGSFFSFHTFGKGWFIFGFFGSFLVWYLQAAIQFLLNRILFFQLTLTDADDEFRWYCAWFSFHPYTLFGAKRIKPKKTHHNFGREPVLNTERGISDDNNGEGSSKASRVKFVPGLGIHLFYVQSKLFIMKLENAGFQKSLIPPSSSVKPSNENCDSKNTAYFTFRDLLDECYYVHDLISREKTTIYSASQHTWRVTSVVEKREKKTVILDEGVWEELYKDVSNFLNSKKWYKDRGIPYRRGYLLYGPPGNGKTSTITSIAACFNLNICVINMGSQNMSDDRLQNAFSTVPKNSIIVLEDIDSSFPKDDPNEQQEPTHEIDVRGMRSVIKTTGKATFSCLLNCLDGISSQESRIVFMTTNFKDKLPPSLLRNGRVDRKVYLGNTTKSQLQRMSQNFYEDFNDELCEKLWDRVGAFTFCMAQLQGFFLRNPSSFESAVEASKNFETFLKEEGTLDK